MRVRYLSPGLNRLTGILFALMLFLAGALAVAPEPQSAPTRLQSRGMVLRAYRTSFGLTQATLARLSGISATKISRIERGLDSATVAQELALARTLDSIIGTRLHPETEAWLVGVVQRVRIPPIGSSRE